VVPETDGIAVTRRLVLSEDRGSTTSVQTGEYTPRLGLISPDSGYGKTRALKILKQLVPEPKLTKNTTAPAMYRRLERRPRTTYLLDEGENQPILTDPVMRSVIDGGFERGGTIDRADGEFPIFFPCAYAIRSSEYDVPLAIRSLRWSDLEAQPCISALIAEYVDSIRWSVLTKARTAALAWPSRA